MPVGLRSPHVDWPIRGNKQILAKRTFILLVFYTLSLATSHTWAHHSCSNSQVNIRDTVTATQTFSPPEPSSKHFKLLLADGDSLLVGARNAVYNISLLTLEENNRIIWPSEDIAKEICENAKDDDEKCDNYIRVIVKQSERDLLICGTNSYRPRCRTYRSDAGHYSSINEDDGTGMCPLDPDYNNTAVLVDGRLYSAAVADRAGRDALIYSEPMRTEQHDSHWLNEPNFVSTYNYGDKVYFFFREAAVEHINCGKAVYSRVARVCQNDKGGSRILKDTWASFFKARLNCSIPGEFPFYFNEIQSTSELGKGYYRPTFLRNDVTDMVYTVFNTPRNSIWGSAVCAFRMSDIIKVFEGPFKEQATATSNWLAVDEDETPKPHPASHCANDSRMIPDQTLDFIKKHPIMEQAVQPFGAEPIVVTTNFRFRMTQIAVDWQVPTTISRSYDVLFIGTDDGRVLKAINKGIGSKVETVIIEDIQVFDNAPVVNLKVYRNTKEWQAKLIVIAKEEVKSIPLHRCHLKTTCRACVALQDPYCSWGNNVCHHSQEGIQNINTGKHQSCPDDTAKSDASSLASPTTSTVNAGTTCVCPSAEGTVVPATTTTTTEHKLTDLVADAPKTTSPLKEPALGATDQTPRTGPNYQAPLTQPAMYGADKMAVAIIMSIFLSLVIGAVIGYKFSSWRNSKKSDNFMTQTIPAGKAENAYDFEPQYNSNKDNYISQKQVNVVYNSLKSNGKLPNGSADTKLSPKVKKVYV